MTAETNNDEEQATAKNKQRRRTSNGEEQTPAKNTQRRRTNNDEEQATAKNKQRRNAGVPPLRRQSTPPSVGMTIVLRYSVGMTVVVIVRSG
jgi:hypothetical protein